MTTTVSIYRNYVLGVPFEIEMFSDLSSTRRQRNHVQRGAARQLGFFGLTCIRLPREGCRDESIDLVSRALLRCGQRADKRCGHRRPTAARGRGSGVRTRLHVRVGLQWEAFDVPSHLTHRTVLTAPGTHQILAAVTRNVVNMSELCPGPHLNEAATGAATTHERHTACTEPHEQASSWLTEAGVGGYEEVVVAETRAEQLVDAPTTVVEAVEDA